jgi:hypothetical protein
MSSRSLHLNLVWKLLDDDLVLRRLLKFAKDFSEILISYFVTVKAVFVERSSNIIDRPFGTHEFPT